MSNKPKLKLTGVDGNAFMILGLAQRASKKSDWTPDQWKDYEEQAQSGDYDNLLQVTMKFFDVV